MAKSTRLKLLPAVAAFLLCVFAGSFMRTAYAEETGAPSLSAQNALAQRGNSVDINVRIANNPGILGATLEVNYDSRLTLTSISNGDAFEKLDMTKPKEMVTGCRIHWDAAEIDDDDVQDGTIVTLSFMVSDSAQVGDSCFVRVVGVNNGGQMDVYDRNLQPVNISPASFAVLVGSDPIVRATGIGLDYESLTLTAIGQRQKLVATVEPNNADDKTVVWNSEDESVATVDKNGLVTAVSDGKTVVSATTNDGGFVARCKVTVDVPAPIIHVLGVDLDKSSIEMTNVGEQAQLSAMVRPEEATDRTVQWKSTDVDVATVSDNGLVQAIADGTAEIVATTTDGGFAARCSVKVDIQKSKKSLIGAVITLGFNSTSYTGSPINPKLAVSLGGKTLDASTDYTIVFSDNINAGIASVTVAGKGNYQGSVTKTFRILPMSVSALSISGLGDQTRTGRAVTPKPTVKRGATVLREGTDYTLSYANNVNAGMATVTVTGRGNYAGSRTATFRIVEPPAPAPAPAPEPTPHVSYRTHVQRIGWQGYVSDGDMSGTSGRSFRLEGINIRLSDLPCSGGIQYRTHVQRIGWQGWRRDGKMAGTSGKSYRLEAIEIKLYGELAERYDVYYRVHCQRFGWMGWARNGERSGSAGYSRRLEGIQIVLVRKGDPAPDTNLKGIRQNVWRAFAQKGKKK